jgi:hypothetical protein
MARFLEQYNGVRVVEGTLTRGTVVLPFTHIIYTGGMQPSKYMQRVGPELLAACCTACVRAVRKRHLGCLGWG